MPYEQVCITVFVLMVYIYEKITFLILGILDGKIPVQIFTHDTDTPFFVFSKTTSDIHIFAYGRATGKDLTVARDCLVTGPFRNDINRARRRSSTTVCPVVGHAYPINTGIRAGCNVHSFHEMGAGFRKLVKQARDSIQHHMISIHVDAAHGKIRIHRRRRADADGWIIDQDTLNRRRRIAKDGDCLSCHALFRIRDIQYIFLTKYSYIGSFVHQSSCQRMGLAPFDSNCREVECLR